VTESIPFLSKKEPESYTSHILCTDGKISSGLMRMSLGQSVGKI